MQDERVSALSQRIRNMPTHSPFAAARDQSYFFASHVKVPVSNKGEIGNILENRTLLTSNVAMQLSIRHRTDRSQHRKGVANVSAHTQIE